MVYEKSIRYCFGSSHFLDGGISVNAAGLEDSFNDKYCADKYTDLYKAFERDSKALLNHFKTYGIKEKRNMSPVLDVVIYRGTYADLEEAFGDDLVAATKHYVEYGYNEDRDQIQKPAPVVPSAPSTTTVVKDGITRIYDANENCIKEIFPDGSYADYEYDSAGNRKKETNSDGYWTKYEYDANGNQYKDYHYGTSGKIESVLESSYIADRIWMGQKEIRYYDYETNKISRIVEWDNTGNIISDIEYNEDGTVKNINE